MSKGISGSGAGFDAPAAGTVAGRFVGRDLPQHQRKGLALKAAMDRARKQAVMPGGPQRVGAHGLLRLGRGQRGVGSAGQRAGALICAALHACRWGPQPAAAVQPQGGCRHRG